MAMYCGVDGAKRKLSKLYAGRDGAKGELTEIWAGGEGAKRLIFKAEADGITISWDVTAVKDTGLQMTVFEMKTEAYLIAVNHPDVSDKETTGSIKVLNPTVSLESLYNNKSTGYTFYIYKNQDLYMFGPITNFYMDTSKSVNITCSVDKNAKKCSIYFDEV